MVVCLCGFRERELFDHAIDIVDLGEINRLFTVQCMTRWPSMYGKTLANHWDGVESSFTGHFEGGSVPGTIWRDVRTYQPESTIFPGALGH